MEGEDPKRQGYVNQVQAVNASYALHWSSKLLRLPGLILISGWYPTLHPCTSISDVAKERL